MPSKAAPIPRLSSTSSPVAGSVPLDDWLLPADGWVAAVEVVVVPAVSAPGVVVELGEDELTGWALEVDGDGLEVPEPEPLAWEAAPLDREPEPPEWELEPLEHSGSTYCWSPADGEGQLADDAAGARRASATRTARQVGKRQLRILRVLHQ